MDKDFLDKLVETITKIQYLSSESEISDLAEDCLWMIENYNRDESGS